MFSSYLSSRRSSGERNFFPPSKMVSIFDSASLPAETSFVRDRLRKTTMEMHPTDILPPVTADRKAFFQFLIDSCCVFNMLEDIVNTHTRFEPLRNTGIELHDALKLDIQWMIEHFPEDCDSSLTVGHAGRAYADHLKYLSLSSIPQFITHYYNIYFAHGAGGRLIGKEISKRLLEGYNLKFYILKEDTNLIKEDVKTRIDALASKWTPEEEEDCLDGIPDCFKFGQELLKYLYPLGAFHEGK
ncbi:putative Heme oxygenase 1, chloroplastic [Cardiosporidium cionae]|uniref:Heme oxygenase 1, chloroplastic n=1 Tax=Cardiosporidium cionae TaxID=476202 RepID=A0ABQ7JCF9_9APIC|nr:putative Heme oxygenase 1, chloroplastic [Cardiosporidium cionae]|eukprot:KAF8821644.1 putative Heme oxygenase 1, chloroplastic [Cardiosporidium cionae]